MDRRPPVQEEGADPASKKSKSSNEPSVVLMTFALSHSPVTVEILESQTIFQLVDIVCRETTIGDMEESVYDHMWDVIVPGKGKYNSSEDFNNPSGSKKATRTKLSDLDLALNAELTLEYDYGSTTYYSMTLVGKTNTTETIDSFPRRQKVESPVVSGMTEFKTDPAIDLNATFPNLNKWTKTAARLSLNLFQAGTKCNWGFLERGNNGCRHMIYLPAKPRSLAEYLHTMDHATKFASQPLQYNWFSMVVFPSSNQALYKKYGRDLEPGFCEAEVAPELQQQPSMDLEQVFPKLSSLSGFGKKDSSVPKGWITYENKILRVCSGTPQAHESNAPEDTAWDGIQQHKPQGAGSVICEMDVKIQSVHHLLCTVEGLLRTLS